MPSAYQKRDRLLDYLYLSRELDKQPDEVHRMVLIDTLRNGSVSTWRHFNLHGEFDFSDERMVDSIGLGLPKRPSLKPN
ncbi:MAG: hypothetical protein ABIU05_09330 [Nitrospirales bacterium]